MMQSIQTYDNTEEYHQIASDSSNIKDIMTDLNTLVQKQEPPLRVVEESTVEIEELLDEATRELDGVKSHSLKGKSMIIALSGAAIGGVVGIVIGALGGPVGSTVGAHIGAAIGAGVIGSGIGVGIVSTPFIVQKLV